MKCLPFERGQALVETALFGLLAALQLVGSGTRQGLLGRADLLAAARLACLFPWPALVLALAGLEAWRRFWVPRQDGPVPALPGLLLGILAYLGLRLAFSPA